ncbi:MAG: ribosome maturation factor RimP [Pseudomonadota bacterium]|nr:ribosome maturation factor RimP [Pseudomonadota bacterium]
MDIVQKITQIIEPSLAAMGYALVQVKLGDGRRKTLSVMAERSDSAGMSIDDCGKISQQVSALLDVDDPIQGAYDLEVCSPGLDRPLTKLEDFIRFTGNEAKIETMLPIGPSRKFRGMIQRVEDDTIILVIPEGEIRIAVGNIRNAKLMMSEALAKAKLKNQKPKKENKK